jgi:hypothetical protein
MQDGNDRKKIINLGAQDQNLREAVGVRLKTLTGVWFLVEEFDQK